MASNLIYSAQIPWKSSSKSFRFGFIRVDEETKTSGRFIIFWEKQTWKSMWKRNWFYSVSDRMGYGCRLTNMKYRHKYRFHFLSLLLFFFIFAPVKCAISIVSAFVGVSVGEKIAFRASFQFHEIRLSLHCIHLAAVISWRSDSCHRNLFNDKLYFLSPQLQMGVHVFALKRVL